MKFLCDEMLQRLGRWLRTAGYDTEIISDGRDDYVIFKLTRKENRQLLTCDRALTKYRDAAKHVVYLEPGSLDELADQVSQKCQVNWLFRPFTRCRTCNTPLKKADKEQHKIIPDDIKQISKDAYYCPSCHKVYWSGGHVQRMRSQLERWYASFNS